MTREKVIYRMRKYVEIVKNGDYDLDTMVRCYVLRNDVEKYLTKEEIANIVKEVVA